MVDEPENAERKATRLDFERTMADLRGRPPAEQAFIGYTINMANSLFVKSFGSVEKFAALPTAKRMSYFGELQTVIEKAKASGDRNSLAGLRLFRIWLVGKAMGTTDKVLLQAVDQGMAELSRKGTIPPADGERRARADRKPSLLNGLFGWFKKRDTVELNFDDGKGGVKGHTLTKAQFEKLKAIGALTPVEGCLAYYMDPLMQEPSTRNLIIGEHITRETYEKFKDPKGNIHMVGVFKEGELERSWVTKPVWDDVLKAMGKS